jgi:hypothetical protein
MRAPVALLLLLALPVGGRPAAADEEAPAASYLTSEEVGHAIEELVRRAGAEGLPASRVPYGTSAGGRPLVALRLGRKAPTVLVHGGLGGRAAAGPVACLALARRILAGEGESREVSWLLVPAPHPDALDAFLAGGPRAGGGNVDRDKDGRLGEDGPDDLDGDGEVLQMRRRSPTGAFAPLPAPKPPAEAGEPPPPDPATRPLVEEGVDARREASFEAFEEGRDDDGDGQVNEDPPGLDLTRQMTGWWEDKAPWRGDGLFPGQAPEAKALMDLSLAEAGLVLWAGYEGSGPHLLRASEAGKVADADDPLYERVATALADASGRKVRKASELGRDDPGSDLDWAATHLGVLAFRLPVWWIAKEEGHAAERDVADEHDWMLFDARVLGGKGFQPWTPFAHPTLGAVEIGGWRRFTRHEPPPALLGAAVDAAGRWALPFARFRPRLAADVEVEPRGGGIHEVTLRVRNAGEGPTDTKAAEEHERSFPVRARIVPASGATTLGGPAVQRLGRLEAGAAAEEVRWLVRGPLQGSLARIEVRHPRAEPLDVEARVP